MQRNTGRPEAGAAHRRRKSCPHGSRHSGGATIQHKQRPDPVELAGGGTARLQGSSRRRLLVLRCSARPGCRSCSASTQHLWCCSPAMKLQRSIHGAARRRQSCNAAAMVLQRSIYSVTRRRQSCNSTAMVLQCSIHGAARRRRSFNAASMALGRSYNRASTERQCCVGARPELQ